MATEKRLIYTGELKEMLADMEATGGHKYYRQGANCILHEIRPQIIDDCPTVDAVEVVHGHNLKDHDSAFECSICGWEDWDTLTADTSKYNYCPNCGADMRGDGNV